MKPYTYLIVLKETGQFYYGARYSNDCSPNDLWTTYFTSSKHIHRLIDQFGKEAFLFQIRRTFNTKEDALRWEQKVLVKIIEHPKC